MITIQMSQENLGNQGVAERLIVIANEIAEGARMGDSPSWSMTGFEEPKRVVIDEDKTREAYKYATKCHEMTRHLYDGNPYEFHLAKVVGYAQRFSYLLTSFDEQQTIAVCSAWCHDVIEDTRQTYNDVCDAVGEDVAEVVFLLTNLRGKNREERAGKEYYEGIKKNDVATFVKICDRLANASYSKETRSSMLPVYRQECEKFSEYLYREDFSIMFTELLAILTPTI